MYDVNRRKKDWWFCHVVWLSFPPPTPPPSPSFSPSKMGKYGDCFIEGEFITCLRIMRIQDKILI
jgi:hypothetical protein